MKKLLLISFIYISLINNIYSQKNYKSVKVESFSKNVNIPVIKKQGKKASPREVTMSMHMITYEIKYKKWLTVGKYIETYKGKRIKELIFDTELLESNRFNKRDISKKLKVKEIINTFNSTTNFLSICCEFYKKPFFKKSYREQIKVIKTLENKNTSFTVQNDFYDSFSNTYLSDDLKQKGFSKEASNELKEIKKYIDDKYLIKAEEERITKSFESLRKGLNSENSILKNRLRPYIPNLYGTNSPSAHVDAFMNNNVTFRFLDESYLWDPYKTTSLQSKHHGHLLIQYPEGSPFEGEVYLEQIQQNDRNGYERVMKVYKSTTKNKIPYNTLVTNSYLRLKIYGFDGSYNNITSYPNESELKNSKKVTGTYRLGSSGEEGYKNAKFLNYYLKRELPIRKQEYYAFTSGAKLREQKKKELIITNYEKEKKESIEKYGFFLETKDIENISDQSIDYRLELIYKGEFDKNGRMEINGYTTKPLKEIELISLIYTSMYQNARHCNQKNSNHKRVQIYEDVCIEHAVTKENGREVNRSCSKWKEKPTGLYTSEIVYAAFKKQKQNTASLKGFLNILKVISNPKKANRITEYAELLKKDIREIYRLNSCNSKALQRFEENLARFIAKQEPIKLK
tara:strand:- start:13234 stop:15114 length:1881 start_codon:yes stop_codon:yes gene_type:complete